MQWPETVRLDDALRIFRQRGLELLIADAAVASAEGDVAVAGAVPNPSWTAMPSYVVNNEQLTTPGQASLSPWGITVGAGDSNALEDSLSGKRWLRLRVARAALAAARMSRCDAQRSLELQVKTLHLQAVLARDNLDFALQVQEASSTVLQLNQMRYGAGAISEADLAKVQTARLEADQAVDAATLALSVAKLQLAFLLGVRDKVPDYKVDPDLPKFVVPAALAAADLDQLLALARMHRPDLRAVTLQGERALAGIALARRQRIPDIGLSLSDSQVGPLSAAPGAPLQAATVGFGLSGTLPLFYQQQGEVRKAEADYRNQELQRAKTEAQIVTDVQGALTAFTVNRRLVARMESQLLDRARRARDLVLLQYQKGAASLLEYLDAERTFIVTNVEYLQDLASYWTAVYQLEAAVGMDLR